MNMTLPLERRSLSRTKSFYLVFVFVFTKIRQSKYYSTVEFSFRDCDYTHRQISEGVGSHTTPTFLKSHPVLAI